MTVGIPYNDGGYGFPPKLLAACNSRKLIKFVLSVGMAYRRVHSLGIIELPVEITAPWYNVDQAMPSEYHLREPCEKLAWAF